MIITRARETFWSHKAKNTRATAYLVILMILVTAAVASGIAYYYDPEIWWIGAIGGCAVSGFMFSLVQVRGANWILAMTDAREASPEEERKLVNVGNEMAIAAGIPMPKLYVMDTLIPNAYATGFSPRNAAVCVTKGLLERLNREELQGVVAHEIAHIKNYDVRLMTMLALSVGFIVMMRDFFVRHGWRARRSSKDSGGHPLILVAVLLLIVIAPLMAILLKMAVSRKREFLADATAAQLTRYPDGLASALEKLDDLSAPIPDVSGATAHMFIVNPMKARGYDRVSLFSTHPPIRERVLRLRSMGLQKTPENFLLGTKTPG